MDLQTDKDIRDIEQDIELYLEEIRLNLGYIEKARERIRELRNRYA